MFFRNSETSTSRFCSKPSLKSMRRIVKDEWVKTICVFLGQDTNDKPVNRCSRQSFLPILISGAGEEQAVSALQNWYLTRDPQGAWSADWRLSADRVQPGGGGASQCQESWHRHRLRVSLPTMQVGLEDYVKQLGDFLETRYKTLSASQDLLLDAPALKWCHTFIREAKSILSAGDFAKLTSEDGTVWYMMRKSVADEDAQMQIRTHCCSIFFWSFFTLKC